MPASPSQTTFELQASSTGIAKSRAEARNELQNVKLPEAAGVGNGTVQYLLGVCLDNLGNRAEAETAWRAAASSESWLTEDGPPVKELAEARLADMQRRPAR